MASEERANFNDTVVRPDDGLRQQILQNITNAQQDRLGQWNAVRAQGAAIPGNLASNAMTAGVNGFKLAQGSEEHNSRMKQAEATTAGLGVQNQLAQMKLSEEQRQQDYLNSDADDGSGRSRGEQRMDAQTQEILQGPEAQKHAMDVQDKELTMQQKSASDAHDEFNQRMSMMKTTAKNSAEELARGRVGTALTAIYSQPGLSDQAKDAQRDQFLASSPDASQIDPAWLNTAKIEGKTAGLRAISTGMMATEAAKATSPGYVAMKDATDKTGQAVLAHQTLGRLAAQYNTHPFTPKMLDSTAQAAQENAAQAADSFEPGLGNRIRGVGIDSVPARIAEVQKYVAQRAQDQWTEAQKQIDPMWQKEPAFQNAQQSIAGLSQGANKPKYNLSGQGNVDLSTLNKQYVQGNQQPGGAVAAPAPQPQTPMPQQPMPQQGVQPGQSPIDWTQGWGQIAPGAQ